MLRAMRLKEWQAFQFGNSKWFFVVALFDAKFMALAQLKAYDREQRRKYVFERQLPSWTMQAPRNLLDSSMSYAGRGASIRFVNELARERITITLELPAQRERPAIEGELTQRMRRAHHLRAGKDQPRGVGRHHEGGNPLGALGGVSGGEDGVDVGDAGV